MPYDLIGWYLVDVDYLSIVLLQRMHVFSSYISPPDGRKISLENLVGRPRSSTMDSRLAKNLAKLDKVGRRTTVPLTLDTNETNETVPTPTV